MSTILTVVELQLPLIGAAAHTLSLNGRRTIDE